MKKFTVLGHSTPQGSMTPMRSKSTGAMINKPRKNLLPWRNDVGREAMIARVPCIERDTAVEIELTFYFQRPKSVKREEMTVPPDIDKLERAILDALKSIAFVDDAQVVKVTKEKLYGTPERVEISVGPKQKTNLT